MSSIISCTFSRPQESRPGSFRSVPTSLRQLCNITQTDREERNVGICSIQAARLQCSRGFLGLLEESSDCLPPADADKPSGAIFFALLGQLYGPLPTFRSRVKKRRGRPKANPLTHRKFAADPPRVHSGLPPSTPELPCHSGNVLAHPEQIGAYPKVLGHSCV